MDAVDRLLDGVVRDPAAGVFLAQLGDYDAYTYSHCINVGVLAMGFGRSLGLKEGLVRMLGLAGLLHDLGKSKVPEAVLNKPGRLDPGEFEIMKGHAQAGYDLLRTRRDLPSNVLAGVRHHHERHNGAGYPLGLGGKDIPLPARVLAVVDVYDAMTSDRCYHKGRTPHEVLRHMARWRRQHFAPGLVEKLMAFLGVYPPGSLVLLSDGRLGAVCAPNPRDPERPLVGLVQGGSVTAATVDLALEPELSVASCLEPEVHGLDVSPLLSDSPS
jgi:putative nucleotidyltransferase with HDIG domain